MAFIHEHFNLPLSDLLKGESVHKYLRLLREAERWSDEQMLHFQQDRLRKLIFHAAKQVPFYRDWFHSHSIDPLSATLDQLPIVDKALMRREGIERFAAEGFPERERLSSRSSGSTGEPFTFYESRESYSVNMAVKLHSWIKAGYRLGDRYMKIANSQRQGHLKQLQDYINHCIYVPFYTMDEASLRAILDRIEQEKPLYIRSYPAPLHLLAQYRKSHSGYHHRPRHIMTTGATLTESHRADIERAFGCDIIDSYSCEGTPATYETTVHDGYCVANLYGIIETIDSHGQPVNDGIGHVVSTDLWNLAHPFIRYNTQDLVEVKAGRIQRIMGRESESIAAPNGTMITIHNLTKFFANDFAGIEAYRMIYRKDKTVEFQLVVNQTFAQEDIQRIANHWHEVLELPVIVRLVDDIPLMHNNKRKTIINETTD
jgi:phenylacetate-CoA ligase